MTNYRNLNWVLILAIALLGVMTLCVMTNQSIHLTVFFGVMALWGQQAAIHNA